MSGVLKLLTVSIAMGGKEKKKTILVFVILIL